MSNLEVHAEREMRRAGLYDKDADYEGLIPDAVMKLIRVHAAEGHSGGSHAIVMEIFNRVANFKTLTPLTSAPEEWQDMSEYGGDKPLWQNLRDSTWFSTDGGQTAYTIEDPKREVKPMASPDQPAAQGGQG